MAFRVHEFQVADQAIGENVGVSGGSMVVLAAGGTARTALFDPDADFAALAQPVVAVGGKFRFAVAEAVLSVDVYGVAPGGQAFQRLAQGAQANNEIWINSNQPHNVMVIPFNFADFTIGSSVASGFTEPVGAIFNGLGAAIKVVDVDATETMDCGPNSDPNGFLAVTLTSVAGLAAVKGLLLEVATTNEQLDHFSGGEVIELTLTAGTDTATGFIRLPYQLPVEGA